MSAHAELSYAPGQPIVGLAFARASVATFVAEISDVVQIYWPGQLHLTETFARASVATYTEETDYPESA